VCPYLGHDLFGAAGPRLPAALTAGAASATPGWWRGPDGDLVPCDLLVDGDGHGSPRRIAEAAPSAVFVPMGRKVSLRYPPRRSQPRSVMGEPTGLGAGSQISTFSGRRTARPLRGVDQRSDLRYELPEFASSEQTDRFAQSKGCCAGRRGRRLAEIANGREEVAMRSRCLFCGTAAGPFVEADWLFRVTICVGCHRRPSLGHATESRHQGRLEQPPKSARTVGPPQGADAPLSQSREALLPARPLHSPRGMTSGDPPPSRQGVHRWRA
jgi:hypothetical protein